MFFHGSRWIQNHREFRSFFCTNTSSRYSEKNTYCTRWGKGKKLCQRSLVSGIVAAVRTWGKNLSNAFWQIMTRELYENDKTSSKMARLIRYSIMKCRIYHGFIIIPIRLIYIFIPKPKIYPMKCNFVAVSKANGPSKLTIIIIQLYLHLICGFTQISTIFIRSF